MERKNEVGTLDKRRIFLFDILRIIFAVLVFMSHTIGMYGCTYGQKADIFIMAVRGTVMTGFFMLSGFAVRFSCRNYTFESWKEVKRFYLRRGLAILPAYYTFHIVWCCFFEEDIKLSLLLTPVEIFGVQSVFNSLFGILHNGGTWFISCILFAYFVYPLNHKILINLSIKLKTILLIITVLGLQYVNFVVAQLNLGGFYSDPIFRTGEFLTGVLLCDLFVNMDKKVLKRFILGDACCLFALILWLKIRRGGTYLDILKIELVVIEFLIIIFAVAYQTRSKFFECNCVLKYFSKVTFEIYLVQMYAWKISDLLLGETGTNLQKIIISSIVTGVLAVALERLCVVIKKVIENSSQYKSLIAADI